MAYLADYLNSLSSVELAEVEAAVRNRVFGATPFVMKPSGDGRGGAFDAQQDDTTGYLFHLRAGPNSGTNAAIMGVGTDEGAAGGILVSHKNASFGYRLIANPGTGYGFYATAWALNPAFFMDVASGANGIRLQARTGAGFKDGVTTAGSKELTSATANFVAGDVGSGLTQLTSIASTSPSGSIPAGATIASVTNSTTVVMSAPATANATGLMFSVAARAMKNTEEYFSLYGADGVRRGAIYYSLFDWSTGGRFKASFASQTAFTVKATTGQTGDLFQAVNNADAVLSRINKSGTYMTRVTTAPADADIATGEMAFWFDQTAGASKLMIKAKNASGAVVGTSIALT